MYLHIKENHTKENLSFIKGNLETFSEKVPKSTVTDATEKCIQLEIKVKDSWELEHLKMDVESGVFMKRYIAWLDKNGGIVDEGQKVKVEVISNGSILTSFEDTIPTHNSGTIIMISYRL